MRQGFEEDQTIGQTRQPGMVRPLSTKDIHLLREEALDQISRFRSLLERSQDAKVEDCRQILAVIDELKFDIPATLAEFGPLAEVGDTTLLAALRDVSDELEPLEQEIRQRLGGFQAANTPHLEELTSLRRELAERAARRELGETVFAATPVRLEMPMRRSSLAGIPMIVFGVGWLSFTTFHATLMIGGFAKAFGPAALFLLAFYSIFYLVGFGMLWGGVSSFRKETLSLLGKELILRYNLFGYEWEKKHMLDPRSRAWVTTPTVQSRGSMAMEIAVLTGDGKEIRMGNGLPPPLLEEETARINNYLRSVFGKER